MNNYAPRIRIIPRTASRDSRPRQPLEQRSMPSQSVFKQSDHGMKRSKLLSSFIPYISSNELTARSGCLNWQATAKSCLDAGHNYSSHTHAVKNLSLRL